MSIKNRDKITKMNVTIVLPAYNAENTLRQTVADIPQNDNYSVILVDDASSDKTAELAEELQIKTFVHQKNLGYGGNQKTCYHLALEQGADVIVMLHPDYQYDPKLIPHMVSLLDEGYFDMMLGSRIRSRKEALANGMPYYKYFSNRALSLFENIVTGHNLSEWHTGMRAYRREVLETIDFDSNSNDFMFDSQVLFQTIATGFSIGELSVPVRYMPEASSINLTRSIEYGLGTLKAAFHFLKGDYNPKR